MQNKNPSPAFLAAYEEGQRQRAAGLDGQDPRVVAAWTQMLRLAPENIRDMLAEAAAEMGLLPEPNGRTLAGEPIYSMASIARHSGVDEATAQASFDAFCAASGACAAPVPAWWIAR
ncbi:hypothetical protein [uncultured Thiodictyon sp.]|uniref:hypothetical protein n=1 Tax=uncultured Thiodictyon sp. TaxID=1846217 RepID=UPI0025CE25BC|nr:hypothetical protein [uncultured Thiodictyon sp.]